MCLVLLALASLASLTTHELSQLTDGGGPRGPWPVQLRGELPEAELAAAECAVSAAGSGTVAGAGADAGAGGSAAAWQLC